jgi:hypothetical protein
LTPFGALLQGIGLLYWVVVIGVAVLAWRWPKRRAVKLGACAAVLVLALAPTINQYRAQSAAKARYQAAMAHFEMRCKSAGEKIVRTVENVEGVVWMKWRDKYDVGDDYDQFKLSDPYGRDCNAEGCIEQLLRATKGAELDPKNELHARAGYSFVDTLEPQSKQWRRYTRQLYRQKERDPKFADWAIASEVAWKAIERPTARYGVTWDDISTREDREFWVAGGSIKVVDLQTNEVIAERIGYIIDRGQGGKGGFRSPWSWALSYGPMCPQRRLSDTFLFVSKALIPITKEK